MKVFVFNVGDFPIDLSEVYGADEAKRRFGPDAANAWFPSNSMLITAPGAVVVVDPGDSSRLAAAMNPKPDPARFRPVPLARQMERLGVRGEDVTQVVVTHLHFDHFAGVTREVDGHRVPSFPGARHLIPAADWNMPDIADGRRKGDRDLASTLGVLEKAGLVDLVSSRVRIAPGLATEPYPGESPGHQVVSVSSGGSRCYCIGDLFHVAPEVDHPELMAVWVDREALRASKAKFAARASKERALVLGGHMRPGWITESRGAHRWKEA
ncbi:MAG TPA: MBL fold metallo-hydrolase [Nitrososphaerales archaeon]|nr:MBL fold metallo-hydrolase [Nitrososphaerales archaeon]